MSYTHGAITVDPFAVVKIAEAANKAILEIYNGDPADIGLEHKDGEEPLTRADKAANKVIVAGLKEITPSVPIVSEESAQLPWEERKHFTHFWCVDPLDGTKEFVARNGQFTVNIALCRGSAPVLGVVTVPVTQKAYYAVEGKGAFRRNGPEEEFQKIRAAEFSEDDEGLTIIGSRSHQNAQTQEWMSKYKNAKFITMGSSLKFLAVAEGSAHVYPRIAPTREWDSCAAHAVVNEAGGCVLQVSGGQPAEDGKEVRYNKEDLLNPYFVVYGARK